MKRTLAIIGLLALLVSTASTEPWLPFSQTITAGTAIRLTSNPTLVSSLSFQMHSGGTGRGYMLFAPKNVTCALNGGGTVLIAELNAATATAAGAQGVVPSNSDPQGGIDASLYCIDGTHSGDVVTIAGNLRN
jgi:hypothetical protein